MAAEQDIEVDDELSKAQKQLRDLKARISAQSKKNFVLERDVRYLDSRIALLIQNRMALSEQNEMASRLDEALSPVEAHKTLDNRRLNQYGNLFFLLQIEPRHIAGLCKLASLSEIDTLLQTVMFTIYGNQYESREEHLLLTMFQTVLSSQFETTSEFSNLLRANTPVSRMMTTYTRRGPGQSYLKAILSERINSLIQHKDLNLEINPLKVYEQMVRQIEDSTGTLPASLARSVSAEVAAANENVQAIIAPRIAMLMDIAESFLQTIIDSLEFVPYGVRWICKQIRSLTRRKYPNSSEYAMCSLIGGFFFLRFVNPAIVTPQAYMLIDNTPTDNPRRTLTLVAKMLQNLANKPSHSKEDYMSKLTEFADRNKQRITKFLNDLCEVGDFFDSLEMDQYLALSKKDLKLNITLNEIYSTHALLQSQLDTLAPDPQSHLRVCLDELGPAPPLLPRSENYTIEIPLYSKWELPVPGITSSLDITHNEILFMETKATFVQLLRTLPSNNITHRPLDLPRIADASAKVRDAATVRRGIRAMELLSELTEVGVVDASDHHSPLDDEIEQELAHLGSLKDLVLQEIESLHGVHTTLCEFHSYLAGQLETYKSYLQNCRITSSAATEAKNKGSKKGSSGVSSGAVGVVGVGGKERKQSLPQVLGPFKFTHNQLEKDEVIVESSVPLER